MENSIPSIQPSVASKKSIASTVDFDSLLAQKDARKILRKMLPQKLYYALKEKGPENCLAVLDLLSNEQFQRIIDYDVWHKERLVPKKLFSWLELYHEIEPKKMVERFADLDEEYQIAALAPLLRFYDNDDFESLSEDKQDRLQQFPNQALYYEICSDDPDIHRQITTLLETAMGENMRYAIALVSHSAMSPPEEAEHLLQQFRSARLQEDGFVPFTESQEIFLPLDLRAKKKPTLMSLDSALSLDSKGLLFLDEVLKVGQKGEHYKSLPDLQTALLSCANHLCAALDIEPSDRPSLEFLLGQARSLISLALEYLSNSDPETGFGFLKTEYPKALFRFGLFLLQDLQLYAVKSLASSTPEKAKKLLDYLVQQKFVSLKNYIDTHLLDLLGFIDTQRLSGLLSRLPLRLKQEGANRLSLTTVDSLKDLIDFRNELIALNLKLQIEANQLPSSIDELKNLLQARPQLINNLAVFQAIDTANENSILQILRTL